MKYVFDTDNLKRYVFPTHINDIVVDRKDAAASEVFVVIVAPGKATHQHKHNDVEQIFYVVNGSGILTIGEGKEEFDINPSQVVRIPPGTLHTVAAKGSKPLCYICVDCFCGGKPVAEPTWESHVHTICHEQGYHFNEVAVKEKGGIHSKF